MSTPAWISSLPSGIVATDLTKDAATGVFNYADALQLLEDVENAGAVTASEFSALQTVAANLNNGLATSAYVSSIFTQLVDGSPANATWTGGSTTGPISLGDLKSGTSAQDVAYLLGQWFSGTNLPDPTPPSGSGYTVSGYSAITGPLYGSSGAAAINDVVQGGDGDCELMSGLIAMVENHSQSLASMIVANSNGTYGVRFYVAGNEVWETVNDQLPTYQNELVFAQNPNEQNTAIWVALIEKAYVQLSATGLTDHDTVNSYNNINSDSAADVLPNLTDASQVNYFYGTDSDYTVDKQWYIDAFNSGDDVIVETGDNAKDTYDSSGNIELVGDHAFAVVGYDSATGDFILRNPWGSAYTGQNWDAQFEASLAQIASVQGDFAIDNTGTDKSTMTVISQSGQIHGGVATSLSGFFQIYDTTGAAVTEYNIQLLGGGTVALNGATNLATAAQTAAGQIVVSAANLAKITITAASSAGQQSLLVSAYDGKAWSATADIQLQVAATGTAVLNPTLGAIVAAGGSVSVSSLFAGTTGTYYAFLVPTGGGTLDLNGATNDWNGGQAQGYTAYEVAADQLSLVTYAAPTTGGAQTLQGQIYSGSTWSTWQNIQVNVAVGAKAALLDYANGLVGTGAAVVDTAANIFANLNALQAAFAARELTAIDASNTTLQQESLGQAQYAADHGLISILQGDVAVTEIMARDNFLGAGISDYLIENTSGVVAIGQIGSGDQAAYTVVSDLGSDWKFGGVGDFLGNGGEQFLIENASGAVDVGSVSGGSATYEQVSGLGSEWTFKETGNFLAGGDDQFLIENTAGSVAIGNVVKGQVAYSVIGALGSEWKFVGAGDFLGEGHDQFLIENSAGAVVVGDVKDGQAVYTVVGSLGPEWTFEATGAFLGTPGEGSSPKTDFLLENTSGSVYIGEVGANDQVTYTAITSLGAGWSFVGAGDYLDEGHDQFVMQDSAGAVVIGDYYSGAIHFTEVSSLGSEWTFHS